MTTKLQFLADHPIFADLMDDELLALNQLAREYSFEADSVIAYQRDVADSMYLVRDGRLYAKEVDDLGIVRDGNTRQYGPNDFFGAQWFRPGGLGLIKRTSDHAGKSGSRFVFFE